MAGHILIINLHSSRNVGDAALLEMAFTTLQETFPGRRFVLAMNDPDLRYATPDGSVSVIRSFVAHCGASRTGLKVLQELWAITRVIALSFWMALAYRRGGGLPGRLPAGLLELSTAYIDADLVVSCPGNIFASTSWIGKSFALAAYTVAYALMLNKPLYVLPQSIGPLYHAWQRLAVRALYSRARLVFVREPLSFRLAQEIGLPPTKLRLSPDLAFALPSVADAEAWQMLAGFGIPDGSPRLGVTVINRLLHTEDAVIWERYEEALTQALARFLQTYGGSVIFFPQVTGPTEREDDRLAARRIVAAMGQPARTFLIEDPLPARTLKGLVGAMDLFVATRMHSAIFAVGMYVPTLMIEYLTKTRGLAEMLELESWRMDLASVSVESLWGKLDRLWTARDIVRAHLRSRVPALQNRIAQVGQAIAEDFNGR